MARYVDEFASLCAQLVKMGESTTLPEPFKAPLLLCSLGNRSGLESTVSALLLRGIDYLSWESITLDLIKEQKRIKYSTRALWKSRGNRGVSHVVAHHRLRAD